MKADLTQDSPGESPIMLLEDDPPQSVGPEPWKVAVIDDDPAVHDGTRFALQNYRLDGRGLELLYARNAREGRELLHAHPDIAVILLDVVMESDDAGLQLADHIRSGLGNETARIILRTGQPGQAPEHRVVVDYDINDYKAKTELTADKLFTSITVALRGYEHIRRLTATRRGLEQVVAATARMQEAASLGQLADCVLAEVAALTGAPGDGIAFTCSGAGELAIAAASGRYVALPGADPDAPRWPGTPEDIAAILASRDHRFEPDRLIFYIPAGAESGLVVFIDAPAALGETDQSLVRLFCERISSAVRTVGLTEDLRQANAELEAKVAARTEALRAVNERLKAQSDCLKRANALKNEVLGTVAHDLKNPLGVILGRAEFLAELLRAPDIDRAAAQAAQIRASAQKLSQMVDARIDDARADATNLTLRLRPLNFTDVVRGAVDENAGHASRKSQRVDVCLADDLTVTGDEDRLGEAIDNLISNAIKYSPIGGRIAVGLNHDGGRAVLCVRDSGPGIAPEDVGRLFGQFQRLSATPTAGESSTGIGLFSAKRVIDLHDGQIELDRTTPAGCGEDGCCGACFRVSLPLAAAESG